MQSNNYRIYEKECQTLYDTVQEWNPKKETETKSNKIFEDVISFRKRVNDALEVVRAAAARGAKFDEENYFKLTQLCQKASDSLRICVNKIEEDSIELTKNSNRSRINEVKKVAALAKSLSNKAQLQLKPGMIEQLSGATNRLNRLKSLPLTNIDLCNAAGRGDLEEVRWLIEECGLSPNGDPSMTGWFHPLMRAYTGTEPGNASSTDSRGRGLHTRGIHMNVVEYLVAKGADINSTWKFNNGTFHCLSLADLAIKEDNRSLFNFLIKKNGDRTGYASSHGATYLHAAAEYGNLEVLKILLERGHDINVIDHLDCTPLHYAVQSYIGQNILHHQHTGRPSNQEKLLEIIQFLIEQGANIDAEDYRKRTVRHLVEQSIIDLTDTVEKNSREKLCQLLVEQKNEKAVEIVNHFQQLCNSAKNWEPETSDDVIIKQISELQTEIEKALQSKNIAKNELTELLDIKNQTSLVLSNCIDKIEAASIVLKHFKKYKADQIKNVVKLAKLLESNEEVQFNSLLSKKLSDAIKLLSPILLYNQLELNSALLELYNSRVLIKDPQCKIHQFEVLDQRKTLGGDESCGYHAFKNALMIQGILTNSEYKEDLINLFNNKEFFEKEVYPFLRENNTHPVDLNPVQLANALRKLKFSFSNLHPLAEILKANPNSPSIIVSEGDNFSCDEITIDHLMNLFIKYEQEGPWSHAIISGRDGHWVTLVLHKTKQGEIIWFGSDSWNNQRNVLAKHKTFIENALQNRRETLKKTFIASFGHFLETKRKWFNQNGKVTNLENIEALMNPDAAYINLERINNALNYLNKFNLLKDPSYQIYIQDLKKMANFYSKSNSFLKEKVQFKVYEVLNLLLKLSLN